MGILEDICVMNSDLYVGSTNNYIKLGRGVRPDEACQALSSQSIRGIFNRTTFKMTVKSPIVVRR